MVSVLLLGIGVATVGIAAFGYLISTFVSR